MKDKWRHELGSWSVALALLVMVTLLVVATQAAAGDRGSPSQPAQGQATATTADGEPEATATVPPTAVTDVVASESPWPTYSFPCTLYVAPEGDRTFCWARDYAVWLGTLSGGLERPILQEYSYVSWAYDDAHLLVTPISDPGASAQPQPVYLYDIETGERTELGKTVRGWLIRTTSTGYVSYPAEGGIEIVNPILGTKTLVSLDMPTPEPPTPVATEPALAETEWPEFLRSTGTPMAMDSPLPTPGPTAHSRWEDYPNYQADHQVSDDGSRMAVLVVDSFRASLWLVDVATGERQLVSEDIPHWTARPFALSPDSGSLAYGVRLYDYSLTTKLLVLDIATGETREVPHGEALGALDWLHWLSPELVFFDVRPGGGDQNDMYYVVGTRGGDPKLLWADGNGANVHFSSDGHRIVHHVSYPEMVGFITTLVY
ncbi:MAG: TolB family protein [Anaerolineae bacterium]